MPNVCVPCMKWIGRCAVLMAAVLTLTGCPGLAPRGDAPPSQDRARNLERSGDHAGAASVYERLAAQNTGTEQNAYFLLAAREYLRARRPDDAQRGATAGRNAPRPRTVG